MKYCKVILFFVICIFQSVNANPRSALWVGVDFKGMPCQGEHENYGPYDYRNIENRQKKLPIVEHYHFTPDVQRLIKGKSGTIVGDLAYTLRAFPNHYKALTALSYYQVLFKDEINLGRKKPVQPAVECYFQRAIHYFKDDAVLHVLYASFLNKIKRHKMADEHYLKAIDIDPDNLRLHYLYGMYLVKRKKFDKALEQAKIVYKGNYKNQKLKKKLIAIGLWQE